MKKGFTLIELLASITIFAICLIIAVPIVINMSNAKEKKYEKRYEKVVCYYGQETKEFYIDELISNNETEIKIKRNNKTYELNKNNCYLIASE